MGRNLFVAVIRFKLIKSLLRLKSAIGHTRTLFLACGYTVPG